jgi:hypothetical protein
VKEQQPDRDFKSIPLLFKSSAPAYKDLQGISNTMLGHDWLNGIRLGLDIPGAQADRCDHSGPKFAKIFGFVRGTKT